MKNTLTGRPISIGIRWTFGQKMTNHLARESLETDFGQSAIIKCTPYTFVF